MAARGIITGFTVRDIRFPTSIEGDGSDSMNDPDYSCVYVTLTTDTGLEGYGLTFTIGRGNDIVCAAAHCYRPLVVGRRVEDILDDFSGYWRDLTQEPQLRWLGPEKGVTHLALAAILNAVWDMWARSEGKPMWKHLVDMDPEKLVSTIDFRYIEDALTKDEAIEILKAKQHGIKSRTEEVKATGVAAYTTSAGWLGYSDDKITRLVKEALAEGYTRFKVKVGVNVEDDRRRVGLVRQLVGPDITMMVDANQRWGVQEAITWMQALAEFNLLWIEEPTSPDDVLGHAAISKALAPLGIGVATGESCQNRVMFKQFLQAGGLQFCQIDSCRLASINEIMAVILMAAKFGVPVCPHAGGVGLCELVQHLTIWDYISVGGTSKNKMTEYVDHLHDHFEDPCVVTGGCYQAPTQAGYSGKMKMESLKQYEYPQGSAWQRLFNDPSYPQYIAPL